MQEAPLVEKAVHKSEEKLHLFVPVDFSSASFNTLQYAMQIAKMCGGSIDLFHAIGIGDIPNSESALSIQHELKKIESEAYRKLNSLKEIATEFGIVISSCHVGIGNPLTSCKLRLSLCASNLLVIRKGENINQWSELNLPILSVPAMLIPKLPSKVLMIRDGKAIQEKALMPLLHMLSFGEKCVTVIDCGPNTRKMRYNYWLPLGNTKVNFSHKYELVCTTEKEIKRVVAKYAPDMICRARRQRSWWNKIWNRPVSIELDVDLPVLIL